MTCFRLPPVSRRDVLLAAIASFVPGSLLAAEKMVTLPRTSAPLVRGSAELKFPTLNAAQAAAVGGALTIGQTVRILGYAERGDGGGTVALAVVPGERGANPHANRLKIIGAL